MSERRKKLEYLRVALCATRNAFEDVDALLGTSEDIIRVMGDAHAAASIALHRVDAELDKEYAAQNAERGR